MAECPAGMKLVSGGMVSYSTYKFPGGFKCVKSSPRSKEDCSPKRVVKVTVTDRWVNPFCMSPLVTLGQFARFWQYKGASGFVQRVKSGSCSTSRLSECSFIEANKGRALTKQVLGVSRQQAHSFCKFLYKRSKLPSEDEWERARTNRSLKDRSNQLMEHLSNRVRGRGQFFLMVGPFRFQNMLLTRFGVKKDHSTKVSTFRCTVPFKRLG